MAERPHQHLRTDFSYNMQIVTGHHCDAGGMPQLMPIEHFPDDLVAWNAAQKSDLTAAVHFFVDDYRFESVWNRPERYLRKLEQFGAVLTPDFSLYVDMPKPMQMWNVYRSRALGNYWQRNGLNVIPTLQWSTPDSYAFSLAGLPPFGVYAVSSVGVRGNKEATALWKNGMSAALELLEPSALLFYGNPVDGFDFGTTEVTYYDNKVIRRLEHGRTRSI